MRTLVVLAVFGVCLASAQFTPEVEAERTRFFEAFRAAKQASSSSKYSEPQPAYRGPFASSVPAGVDGRVTPVSDTAEVRAATNAFYRAYKAQVEATKGSSDSASYVLKTDPATSAKYVLKTDTATSNRYLYKAVPSPFLQEQSAGSETSVKLLLQQLNSEQKGDPAYKAKSDSAYVAKVFLQQHMSKQPRWPGPFASSVPAGLPGSPGQVPYTTRSAGCKYAFQKAYQRQLEAVFQLKE
ncbi:uncharacterized protein LOC135199722 [Macrobrachium nipponense]|uniref:uncharacterized protein LOC135199722 n=1 Tax=Macrobrachium nipponense TaxID=159736 RepID=UPI0030C7BBC2